MDDQLRKFSDKDKMFYDDIQFTTSPIKNQEIINSIGISRRIGNSVLDELDSRTNNKLSLLHNNTELGTSTTGDHSLVEPVTPKKNHPSPIKDLDTTLKRLRTNDSKAIPILKHNNASPVVNDITRRIRRLRLRTSIVNSNQHNTSNINNLNNSDSVRNQKLKNQKPLMTPNFLKPTINSSNRRAINSTHTSSNLNNNTHALNKTADITTNTFGSFNQKKNASFTQKPTIKPTIIQTSKSNAGNANVPKSQITRSASSQVFDRLYKQTNVSRSISMNNVSVQNKTDPVNNRTTANKSRMSRSKTSNTLSSHLSENNKKPVWR